MKRIYEYCKDCEHDSFNVYKEEGDSGTLEECSKCGSTNIGFEGEDE